eukprot:s2993_g5.t4
MQGGGLGEAAVAEHVHKRAQAQATPRTLLSCAGSSKRHDFNSFHGFSVSAQEETSELDLHPRAFNPPVRWNIAGAKSSNLRESLQKHLAMKKQEELRKHEEKTATKQKTPAEPRPWKESSAQAAPTPSAPSRPPPSGGSAWDSAALRLKATGTTEKDKTDLKNFVSDLQLNDEQVELGLQFLERSKLRSLLAQKDRVLKSCHDPAARIENVRKMIAAVFVNESDYTDVLHTVTNLLASSAFHRFLL